MVDLSKPAPHPSTYVYARECVYACAKPNAGVIVVGGATPSVLCGNPLGFLRVQIKRFCTEIKGFFALSLRFPLQGARGVQPLESRGGCGGRRPPTHSGGLWFGRKLARYFEVIPCNPTVGFAAVGSFWSPMLEINP